MVLPMSSLQESRFGRSRHKFPKLPMANLELSGLMIARLFGGLQPVQQLPVLQARRAERILGGSGGLSK